MLAQGLQLGAQAGPRGLEQVALLHHTAEALQQLRDPAPPQDVTHQPPGPGWGCWAPEEGHSRGVGILQEAELIPLAIWAQRLHDRQDASRGEGCCRVEGWGAGRRGPEGEQEGRGRRGARKGEGPGGQEEKVREGHGGAAALGSRQGTDGQETWCK